VSGGATMLEKAKRQYLPMLLNVASGKLQTYTAISEDDPPANVSQALQQIANMILDGHASNDELAKDIAETINNGDLVGAGIIDLALPYVPYEEDPGFVRVIPSEFALSQNRPNPVSPTTTIRLSLPEAADYALSIHDVQGRVVRRFEGSAQPGVVSILWDGRDQNGAPVSAGLYFYRVAADEFSATRKMLLVR
jgi:hypothetical protein